MSKTDKTVFMENEIIKTFHEKGIELHKEVRCFQEKNTSGRGYIDLAGVINDTSLGIEIKVTKQDFDTQNGLNFVCGFNYLAVPEELVGFAIIFLKKNKLDHVGIIVVDEGGMVYFIKESQFQLTKFAEIALEKRSKHIQILATPHLYKRIHEELKVKKISMNDAFEQAMKGWLSHRDWEIK